MIVISKLRSLNKEKNNNKIHNPLRIIFFNRSIFSSLYTNNNYSSFFCFFKIEISYSFAIIIKKYKIFFFLFHYNSLISIRNNFIPFCVVAIFNYYFFVDRKKTEIESDIENETC